MRRFILLLALALATVQANAEITEYKQAPKSDYCPFYDDVVVANKILRKIYSDAEGEIDPYSDKEFPILEPLKKCDAAIARQTIVDTNFGHLKNPYDPKPIYFDGLLDELEAMMISSYVNEGFMFLHAANKQTNPTYAKKMIEVLDRGLSKLPNFEGVVYHGNASVSPKDIKIGQTFAFKSYVSTSTDRIISENFTGGFSSGTIFRIKVKTGKDLSETFNQSESEVLMPRGFRMKVTGKVVDGGRTIVEAEQVL